MKKIVPFLFLFSNTWALTTINVSSESDLRNGIINQIDQNVDTAYQINLNVSSISLTQNLPVINPGAGTTVAITGTLGSPTTINGQNASRAFFIASGSATISNVAILDAVAQGGSSIVSGQNEGAGGGGGLGAGGGLFVNQGVSVTLSNVSFNGCQAKGGTGGAPVFVNYISGGAGGGGMGGNGLGGIFAGGGGGGLSGSGGTGIEGGGGGGGAVFSGSEASESNGTAGGGGGLLGAGGIPTGGAGGGGSGGAPPTNGGTYGGGGGGNGLSSATYSGANGGLFGGGGGGGNPISSSDVGGNGGSGGLGGGGGGGALSNISSPGGSGGNGGFGGGGGGAGGGLGQGMLSTAGTGGYGGGGGGGASSTGGLHAGNGDSAGQGYGGGGAGLGGAVFVRGGGTLIIQDGVSFGTNSTTAGTGSGGASSGSALGNNFWIESEEGGATAVSVNVSGTITLSDMEGAGSTNPFVKSGAGTLILTGSTNNFMTSTTVSGGTLEGTAASLPTAITDNANVTFVDTATDTYTGVISGSGTVTMAGTGTIILTGANSYGGGTLITSGTLQASTSSLPGNVAVSSGANLTLEQSSSATFNGNITGAGSLKTVITGPSGTLTLGGTTYSYSGGTFINQGALEGTTSTLQGNMTIASGANLIFNQAAAGTFSGNMAGQGSVTKDGAGTLTLAGTDAYSGGTFVNGGSLEGTTTSLIGTISTASGTTVIFNQATNGTFFGSISGSGGMTKQNTGTLTLIAPNSYTGTTTVSGGTLLGTTATLPAPITDNANVTFVDSGVGTYAGVISGTGTVTMAGTGTLILTGLNTYGGGTLLTSGSLQGNTTSLQGNFTTSSGTDLIFDQATSATFNGSITGGGALTKINTGTLTLGGTYSYSGGTFINQGALEGTATTLQGNMTIASGANLIFNQATTGTFSGNVTGAGALTKLNAGTLILSGTNSYTGGTTVSAGVLQGTTNSVQGPILNNASVVFDQTFTGTYSGNMSGSGSLTKQDTGTVIMTGTNSYSGGTTVSSGTLQGNTNSLQGNIANAGASLVFDQAFNGAFSGQLTGTGSLTKQNSQILALNGVQTFNGNIFVTGGELLMNSGSSFPSTSDMTVSAGATIAGTGSIGNLDLFGIISPGQNSIGTLPIAGNFTAYPGSSYSLEINNDNGSDLIQVAGTATLNNPVLNITADPGLYMEQTYTILTAANETGQFVLGSLPFAGYSFSLQYFPTIVELSINFVGLYPLINSGNPGKVAQYLDSLTPDINKGGDLANVFFSIASLVNPNAISDALQQLHPAPESDLKWVSFAKREIAQSTIFSVQRESRLQLRREAKKESFVSNLSCQNESLYDADPLSFFAQGEPMQKMPSQGKQKRSHVWLEPYVQAYNQPLYKDFIGIHAETFGTSLGGDTEIVRNLMLGAVVGGALTYFNWKDSFGQGNIQSYYAGLYASYFHPCGLYVDASFLGGQSWYHSHRTIDFTAISRKAYQKHKGFELSTDIQAGYEISFGTVSLEPFLNFMYAWIDQDGYSETGADSINLVVPDLDAQIWQTELGAVLTKNYTTSGGTLFRPMLKLSWIHEEPRNTNPNILTGFVGQSLTLDVVGDNRTRNEVSPGIGLITLFKNGWYLSGMYQGEFGSIENTNEFLFRAGVIF